MGRQVIDPASVGKPRDFEARDPSDGALRLAGTYSVSQAPTRFPVSRSHKANVAGSVLRAVRTVRVVRVAIVASSLPSPSTSHHE